VAISPAVAAILRQHLARQAEERLKMGSRYQDHGLVFCQIDGSPLWPSRITNYVFPHLCKKAGVRRIRLHDLRHTFITHILNAGLPATVAQRRARHTRWSTTVDMYGHITKDVEREGVTVTDDILPRPENWHSLAHAPLMPQNEKSLRRASPLAGRGGEI